MTQRKTRIAAFAAAATILWSAPAGAQPAPTLDPGDIPKYQAPLTIPPAMPRVTKLNRRMAKNVEYYEIAVRQFQQQILPAGLPLTTVWSYGALAQPGTVAEGGSFNYPAFTIEAKHGKPVRVRWVNELRDGAGRFLPHLLPIDPTLHWANPPGGPDGRDRRPSFEGSESPPAAYDGPVPIVVHLHGGHAPEWADGFPEAWYLPDASGIPAGYALEGTQYAAFRDAAQAALDCPNDPTGCWGAGAAVFQYDNAQDAATLWYHDHALGMTRTNVYAGPAGFYLLRGGPADMVVGTLPGPAPALGDLPGTRYYEIPIAIQDRSFNADGSLFYPESRLFFDGFPGPYLPGSNEAASDVSPIWNPEFFGDTMVVNGKTWPYLEVEARRYRFRFLNGSDSRFLILASDWIDPATSAPLPFWQIGSDGGFLPAPVSLSSLLLGPAERADVIMDFTSVPPGTAITLLNLGPDEPFGGGVPGTDFTPADPASTGQVMQFRVVARVGKDPSTPPAQLVLPAKRVLPAVTASRQVSLNELDSDEVCVVEDSDPPVPVPCDAEDAVPFGPREAQLGTVVIGEGGEPMGMPMMWGDSVTENPAVGATEVWEMFNFTMDAHPIHIHEIMFEVVDRQPFDMETGALGAVRPPELWETGFKDTVIAYPGEITRVKATFDRAGLYVWHCHILSHEDNEMMRPYRIGP